MNGKREFYRKAYLKGYPKKGNISFPDPPSKPAESFLTTLLSVLPAIAMFASIFLSQKDNGKIPLYMIIMCLGFVISPITSVIRTFYSIKKYNKEIDFWKDDIQKIYKEYESENEKSKKLLNGSFKPEADYTKIAEEMLPFLWNVLPGDSDFAKCYIGTYSADVFLTAQISRSVKTLVLDKEIENIWNEKTNSIQKIIANTPFIYDFMCNPAIGICGNENESFKAIRACSHKSLQISIDAV